MLPWIAGAIVVSVGAYLLNDAESDNRSARRDYEDEYDNSSSRVNSSSEHARKKDTLDKLFKMKRAKQEIADAIYHELKSHRENFAKVNGELQEFKEMLSALFSEKKSLSSQQEKRAVQNNINIILDSRKEIFRIKDGLKSDMAELRVRLKEANRETKSMQEQINQVLEK